jgi:hypothetical protein
VKLSQKRKDIAASGHHGSRLKESDQRIAGQGDQPGSFGQWKSITRGTKRFEIQSFGG